MLDDQRVFELAMVENLQREDLNAVDKATAFSEYLSRYGGTQEELAGRLGVDRSTVSNLIRLLDLPQDVLESVRRGEITQGHARALLGLPDADGQSIACKQIVDEHLSVRQTEALVATGIPTPARTRVRKDAAHEMVAKAPHFLELEQRFHRYLGTAVLIRARNSERGQIIIDYKSREELDRVAVLLERVGIGSEPH
jgi:ParB family chromosome partitioning protein